VDGTAGGVSLAQAAATFIGCTFAGNECDAPNSGGGGLVLNNGSTAFFVDCAFNGNVATNGGGAMRLGTDSRAYIHSSRLTANRSNMANHRSSATAGGIDVNNATLQVTNTRFENNQAGFAGGGIYSVGTWLQPHSLPRSEIVAANCSFVDNLSAPHPGVNPPSPNEGGAIHVEDQSWLRVFNSRFITNDADLGGGISVYRAKVEVDDSVFLGNRALGIGQSTGFGGAIKVGSGDPASDGGVNYPSASLSLTNSFIMGRYGGVGTVGQLAGGVFAAGDLNRNYGLSGSQVIGGPAVNRAPVLIDRVVFADLDVDRGGVSGQGNGGGLSVSLVALDMSDSLILGCDALGSPTGGGGARIVFDSDAQMTNTTFAHNTADRYGGAVYAQATGFGFSQCQFFGNEISPGVAEPENESLGAAIFAAPMCNAFGLLDIEVSGSVANSTLSLNEGMPIFDDDRNPSPINSVVYNQNSFHNTSFWELVYRHSMQLSQTAAQLNSLVIAHSGVDKGAGNSFLSQPPVLGAIAAVPPQILTQVAAGDPETTTRSYLGYAWSGGNATLDGAAVNDGIGWGATTLGTHTLNVAGEDFQATVSPGPTPMASLSATPQHVGVGEPVTLSWSTTGGNFVSAFIDQGVNISSAPSGQVVVTPSASTTYTLYVVTEEGGTTASATVFVAEEVPLFSDGFESGNTSAWSGAVVN
jgi:predicted outer membrane repeat protein